MDVRRLGWLGTRTDRFVETARFFRDVLGLAISHEEPDFAMLALPGADHDDVEIIGPGAEGSEFQAATYTTGPVVSFVVGDVIAARSELEAAGVELLGDITWSGSSADLGWFHFRGPDGNVYGMMQGSRAFGDRWTGRSGHWVERARWNPR
jgi:catechol 2,3-dioxygenase-like lactoylglutathione lyase family enzyme